MDVGHDVVAEPALVARRGGEVGVVEVRLQRRDRGGGNLEPQLPLGLHERQPEPAPERHPVGFAPELLHRRRGVAGSQRRLIARVGHGRNIRSVKMVCPPRSK